MKQSWLNNFAVLLLLATIAACGGGDGQGTAPGRITGENNAGNGNIGGGNPGGGNSANVLRGVASKGGPMAGVEIVVTEANSTRGARTTTLADGSFALNVDGLNRPLRLFATNSRTAESFALTNVVFDGQTVAHINEATHAITQAMGNTPSAARQEQFEQVLANSLRNYLGSNAGNFVDAPDYKADSTGADGTLALVRVVFVGNGILLESRADPTQRALIDTTVSNPIPALVPAVANNQTIDPVQLRNLVQAFGAALAVQSSSASKFDAVMHPDFQDGDGDTAAEVAEISSLVDVGLERFEILRCMADTASTQDSCLVRIVLKTKALEELDFGNPNFAQVELSDNFDVMVERRTAAPNAGVLKLAGGQFRPYVANTHLLHLAQNSVQANGTLLDSTNPARTDLVLNVESARGNLIDMPGARANQNVNGARLLQTSTGTTSTLLNLQRPNTGECAGILNLVRNPANSTDCTRQVTIDNLNNLELDTRNGRLMLGVSINNIASPRLFQFVRVKRGPAVNAAYFPSLSPTGLRALHAYGRGTLPATALNVELSPPIGFNEVCIAANTEEDTPSTCVRNTRQVSIPNALLPPRLSSYVLFTTDNEGNRFVQRYTLQ